MDHPDEQAGLQQQLLQRTLAYVLEEVPYYKALPGIHDRGPTLKLEDFPLLEPETVSERLEQFLVLDRFPDFLVGSGGTSGRPPKVTFRNTEEYEAAHNYFMQANSEVLIEEFAIDVFLNTHGYYWRKPSGWPMLSVVLEHPGHAEIIRRLIKSGLSVAGRHLPARHIQSQNGPIRTLTGYFLASGFDPRQHGLNSLLVYGNHISRTWRTRLEQFWGLPVQTIYGLSEFAIGNATLCPHCRAFHYWTAWAEFLDLDRRGPVDHGDALLVLTSLVPFTYIQPRIRYVTNDCVTVTGYCERAQQLGFQYRGRLESSVITRATGHQSSVLLSDLEMIEVLDDLPDVNCRAHYSQHQFWSDPGLARPPFTMGFPRFRVSQHEATGSVVASFEAIFDPGDDHARANRLKDRFLHALFEFFPALQGQLQGHLDLEILPPGCLNARVKTT